jgi:hypothetical protein
VIVVVCLLLFIYWPRYYFIPVKAAPFARILFAFIIRDLLMFNHRATVTDEKARISQVILVSQEKQAHIASSEVIVEDHQCLMMAYHGLGMGAVGLQTSRFA